MGKYKIEGGHPLKGIVTVRGSKNGILPILAGIMLTEGETILHNCPCISDVHFYIRNVKTIRLYYKKRR